MNWKKLVAMKIFLFNDRFRKFAKKDISVKIISSFLDVNENTVRQWKNLLKKMDSEQIMELENDYIFARNIFYKLDLTNERAAPSIEFKMLEFIQYD